MECKCNNNNVIPQSQECYDQMILVNIPHHMSDYSTNRILAGLSNQISIDPCILNEIEYLWSLGIITYGSCCGHNILDSFVNVHDKDIELMNELGYINNHPDVTRKDTFRLKGVF